MECRYILIECTIYAQKSYGIAAACVYDDCITIVKAFHNLCLTCEPVVSLVERCNALSLSLCHLSDAVEDFLAEI